MRELELELSPKSHTQRQREMQTMYSENPYAKRCRFVPAAAPNATHRMGTLPWYPFVRRSIWSGERRKGNRFVVEEEEV